MESMLDQRDRRLAYALLRMVVGLNLMMHGVSRLLAGSAAFAEKVTAQFAHTPLPASSVWMFAMSLPAIEALLGLLLLIGLRTRAGLFLVASPRTGGHRRVDSLQHARRSGGRGES